MAYLYDIFGYLNEVNLAMRGTNVTCFKVKDKMNALQGKLKLWGEYIAKGDFECFENLSSFLLANSISLNQDTKDDISQHFSEMANSITEYFPDETKTETWVKNPFVESLNLNKLTRKEREQ